MFINECVMVYILFFMLLLALFLIFLKTKQTKKTKQTNEYFDENKNDDEPKNDDVSVMLTKARKEINQDKNNWVVYNASKNKSKYILTKENDKAIIYTANITNKNNKKIYTINDKDNNFAGVNGSQDDINIPSSKGIFNNTDVNIIYKRGYKRVTINIGDNENTVTGYGGFNSYMDPWYQVVPIVFVDGGTIIGIMDYSDNKKIKKSDTYLPFEIIISKKNKEYLPLFFNIYVLFQEYISNLK